MKHPYSDLMPEIEDSWGQQVVIIDIVKNNTPIKRLEQSTQMKLLEYTFYKMACIFGGYQKLWKTEEEESFLKAGYMNVFQNLTTQALFSGLYAFLSGNTEHKSFMPNALEFLDICRNAPRWPEPEKDRPLEIERQYVSDEKFKVLVSELKKIVKEI